MTYDEATRHATWDEALVYALGRYAEEQARTEYGFIRILLERNGWSCIVQACSRELTLADRDPYEFRLAAYPQFWFSSPAVVS